MKYTQSTDRKFLNLKPSMYHIVDVTTFHDGYHGDLNETFYVGQSVSQRHKELVKCSYDCLSKAIDLGEWAGLLDKRVWGFKGWTKEGATRILAWLLISGCG